MSILKKIREKRSLACGLLLVCLVTLVFPQVAYGAPADEVTLAVGQVFTKPAGSAAADTFTYTLTAKQSGNPMPAGSSGDICTFTISNTDTIDLGPVTYSTVGTYSYEIRQTVASPQTGYTYDRQVYTVEVYATNTAGGLQADVVVYNENGLKVPAIVFENAYEPLASDPSIMVDPPVKKTVSGSPGVNGTFTFKLEAEDKSDPMPAGSKDGVKLMTIIGPGEEDFGTWSYTKAGTYHYTISEVDNGETGYTYDTTVYTITDCVTDADGQLTVARTVTNAANRPVDSYYFVNKYTSVKGVSGPGGGSIDKSIRGAKTGDDAMTGFYQTMLFIGGIVLMALAVYRIRNRKMRIRLSGKWSLKE